MNQPVENTMHDTVILVCRRGKAVLIENDFEVIWGKSAHFTACFANLQYRSAYSAMFNASHSGVTV